MIDSRQRLQLTPNLLLEWAQPQGEENTAPVIERVLDFDAHSDEVVVINILDRRAFPAPRSYKAIQSSYEGGECIVRKNDPFCQLHVPEENIDSKRREIRDQIWLEMLPLIETPVAEARLYSWKRASIVREFKQTTARKRKDGKVGTLSKTTGNKRLRRWWQSGRIKNAFLPEFQNCGAPGKKRLSRSSQVNEQNHKNGRRSALAISTGRQSTGVGVRMTADIYRKFELGLKKFYTNPEGRTLKQTFDLTLQKYFAVDYEIVKGVPVPVLPAADKLPTIHQFYYWYEHVRDDEKEKRARVGHTEFELRSRQMLGDPRKMAFAPGSINQIDATIPDLYLVSALDRTRIIGRPVLYNCIDLFSSAITGFALLLEGPSWLGAMLALDNVSNDKVTFCGDLGIQITEDEWPCKGLPTGILADRGEFEGYNADTLVNAFGIRIHNTAVRRADWKGLVERSFGLAKEKIIRFTPGYVPEIGRNRGTRDYDLQAVMTLDECRRLLACYVLDYNSNHYLANYRMDEYMVAAHVLRYPLELWNWGISSRGGRLTQPSQEIVRLNLLPRKQVSITPRGIHFEGDLYYECETALRENWFLKARTRGQWKIEIAYDPRTTQWIYLPLERGTRLEACNRTPASKNLPALDWYDAMDYYALQRAAHQVSETKRLRSSAALQAQKDDIVGEASEKTRAALAASGEISKKARRRNIRLNRAAEKQLERERTCWSLAQKEPASAHTAHMNGENENESNGADYVPASSKLTQIEALLKTQWRNHDK